MVQFTTPIDPNKILKKPVYTSSDPRPDFMAEMRSHGFIVDALPEVGKIIRVPAPNDKRGKKNGWYIYQEVVDDYQPGAMIGIGVFGSWKGNPERVTWSSKRTESMSPAEKAQMEERIAAAKIARDENLKQRQQAAAVEATKHWESAQPADPENDYFRRKKIKPHIARQIGDTLILPVYCANSDSLSSIQRIMVDGTKMFLSGGKTKGCYCRIEGDSETVYIVEGYATGATIAEATGAEVYIAFNANNLTEVASEVRDRYPNSAVVICGDDDAWTDGNPGRSKATSAADVMRCRAIFPAFQDIDTKPTDFNDLHCLEGLQAVVAQLTGEPELHQHKVEYDAMPERLLSPPGILGDMVAYYNATARAHQPGIAVQTALATVSVLTGRNYRTTKGNHTSMYFLNVAKSGTGKEHAKTVMEDILMAAGQESLLNGAGYTSAGAVISTLLQKPKHITVIDEFGRYIEAAKASKNSNLMEANTQLMEAIGRCHGTMRPTAYSTMTLTKDKADEFQNRKVKNPAITLIAMTTPAALYDNLNSSDIAGGFLGRFIIHQSTQPRMVHDDKDLIDVPNRIVDWAAKIVTRSQPSYNDGVASESPHFETLPFSGEALTALREFDQYRVDLSNELEKSNLEALPGRSKEMAMRMALIVALANDPDAGVVDEAATKWAIDYVRFALEQAVSILKMRVSGSEFESEKKEILAAIRAAGSHGVTWSEMMKTPPFSHHKRKDLRELLGALTDSTKVGLQTVQTGKKGRPREAYVGLK